LIAKLFRSAFCRSMCEIDLRRIKDPLYQEVLLRELRIKSQALTCIKVFLEQASDDTRQRTNALIASYICNAMEFIMHPTGANGNVEKLFRHYLPLELDKAKENLIYCMTKVPPELLKAIHASLFQPLCETICDKQSDSQTSGLTDMLLFKQDDHVGSKRPDK